MEVERAIGYYIVRMTLKSTTRKGMSGTCALFLSFISFMGNKITYASTFTFSRHYLRVFRANEGMDEPLGPGHKLNSSRSAVTSATMSLTEGRTR